MRRRRSERKAAQALPQAKVAQRIAPPPDATVGRSEVGLALSRGGGGFLVPLSRHFFESLAGGLKDGLQPTHRLKPAQAHVAIERIELNSKTAPASPLRRDKCGARPLNGSSTMPLRREQSRIASSIRATGLTVG